MLKSDDMQANPNTSDFTIKGHHVSRQTTTCSGGDGLGYGTHDTANPVTETARTFRDTR